MLAFGACRAAGTGAAGLASGRELLPPDLTSFPSNLGMLSALTREAVNEAIDSLALPPKTPVTVVSSTWHEANWFVGSLMAEALAKRGYPVKIVEMASAPSGGGGGSAPTQPTGGGLPNGLPPPPSGGQGSGSGAGTEGAKTGAPGDTTGSKPDSLKKNENSPDQNKPPDNGTPSGAGAASSQEATPTPLPPQRVFPTGEVLDVRVVEFGIGYSDVNRKALFGPVRFTRVGGVYLQVSHVQGPDGELRKIVSSERHQVDHLSGSQRYLAEGASYPFSPPDLKPPSLGRYIEPTVVITIVGGLVYLFYSNQK